MADKTEFKLNIPAGGMKKATVPILGEVVKTKREGIYAVKEPAIVGKQYMVICPVCGKPVLTKATEPTVFRTMHKTCNAPIIIRGIERASSHDEDITSDPPLTVKTPEIGSKSNHKLSWWTRTGRKKYILRIGENYVGRKDDECPSDLSLKDEYASARSICINVTKTARGFFSHLTVINATNPVLINKKEHPVGSSFDLNESDKIQLGRTVLTFSLIEK